MTERAIEPVTGEFESRVFRQSVDGENLRGELLSL